MDKFCTDHLWLSDYCFDVARCKSFFWSCWTLWAAKFNINCRTLLVVRENTETSRQALCYGQFYSLVVLLTDYVHPCRYNVCNEIRERYSEFLVCFFLQLHNHDLCSFSVGAWGLGRDQKKIIRRYWEEYIECCIDNHPYLGQMPSGDTTRLKEKPTGRVKKCFWISLQTR